MHKLLSYKKKMRLYDESNDRSENFTPFVGQENKKIVYQDSLP